MGEHGQLARFRESGIRGLGYGGTMRQRKRSKISGELVSRPYDFTAKAGWAYTSSRRRHFLRYQCQPQPPPRA
jgi:hypothetical protein